MTCNPQWREVRENVLQNQNAADRPDIVGRVYVLKVDKLLDIIIKKKCLEMYSLSSICYRISKEGIATYIYIYTSVNHFKA